jgi:hypothetical protein
MLLVTAASPFQQNIYPGWRFFNCLGALPLGGPELLRFCKVLGSFAKFFLPGLDCAPRFVVELVDIHAHVIALIAACAWRS